MKALLFLIATIIAAVACATSLVSARRPKWHELTPSYSYDQYLKDFGFTVKTDAEYHMRKKFFEKNLAEILDQNALARAGKSTWKAGVNHLTHLSDKEFRRMRGGKVDKDFDAKLIKERDYVRYVEKHLTGSDFPRPLPRAVDWSTAVPPIMTAIKDQGNCGSCWAHASTEMVETAFAQATGELFVLSQQQITSCAPNPNACGGTGGCEGSIANLAFDYLVQNGGQVQEWVAPYESYFGQDFKCNRTITTDARLVKAKLRGFDLLKANDQQLVEEYVAFVGPVAVNADASHWQHYETGVYDGCHYSKNITIDHVINLVGYGTSDDGTSFYKIRNSWSASWGEDGFIKLKRTRPAECGFNVNTGQGVACLPYPKHEYVCGECGILYSVTYPTVNVNK